MSVSTLTYIDERLWIAVYWAEGNESAAARMKSVQLLKIELADIRISASFNYFCDLSIGELTGYNR